MQCITRIYFGSETGTAESFAMELSDYLNKCDVRNICESLDRWSLKDFRRSLCVLILVSNTGEGEPPRNAESFHSYLLCNRKKEGLFAGIQYAIFGLGDMNYPNFNSVGKRFDHYIRHLGGNRFYRTGLGDACCDLHGDFSQWYSNGLVEKINGVLNERMPSRLTSMSIDTDYGYSASSASEAEAEGGFGSGKRKDIRSAACTLISRQHLGDVLYEIKLGWVPLVKKEGRKSGFHPVPETEVQEPGHKVLDFPPRVDIANTHLHSAFKPINGDAKRINGDANSVKGDANSVNGDTKPINGEARVMNGSSRSSKQNGSLPCVHAGDTVDLFIQEYQFPRKYTVVSAIPWEGVPGGWVATFIISHDRTKPGLYSKALCVDFPFPGEPGRVSVTNTVKAGAFFDCLPGSRYLFVAAGSGVSAALAAMAASSLNNGSRGGRKQSVMCLAAFRYSLAVSERVAEYIYELAPDSQIDLSLHAAVSRPEGTPGRHLNDIFEHCTEVVEEIRRFVQTPQDPRGICLADGLRIVVCGRAAFCKMATDHLYRIFPESIRDVLRNEKRILIESFG